MHAGADPAEPGRDEPSPPDRTGSGTGGAPRPDPWPEYPIETARLTLRPFTVDDLEDLHAFHRLPEVSRFLYWNPRDREQTAAALKDKLSQASVRTEGDNLAVAVVLREIGRVIGEVNLCWTSEPHMQGEIGFVFHPEFHGAGLATEAARELLRLGFDGLGLHRVVGRCDGRNGASARLLQRLGMRREAKLVHNEMFKGEWSSEFIYAMLAHEWRTPGAPLPDLDPPGTGATGTDAAGTDAAGTARAGTGPVGSPAQRSRTYTWWAPAAWPGRSADHGGADLPARNGLQLIQAMDAGELAPPPAMSLLGIERIEADAGHVVVTMRAREFHYNPLGGVHGGVLATLLDTAAGCAVQTTLPPGAGYTSVDLITKFLRPVTVDSGMLRCVGTVIQRGTRTALAQAHLLDEQGRLAAYATSTCLIFDP
jgi:uncharacterized protein (TIGR00369 family)